MARGKSRGRYYVHPSLQKDDSIYSTRIRNVATMMAPVLKEYSPDANGRNGLFICNKTCGRNQYLIARHQYSISSVSE